eukprot:scaffold23509_cov59-Phaeocystis_antarctica.AAC.3
MPARRARGRCRWPAVHGVAEAQCGGGGGGGGVNGVGDGGGVWPADTGGGGVHDGCVAPEHEVRQREALHVPRPAREHARQQRRQQCHAPAGGCYFAGGIYVVEQPSEHPGHVVHQREARQQRAARCAAFPARRHDQDALGKGERRAKGLSADVEP